MATSEAAASDVHAHAHRADQAPETAKRRLFGRKTARADATPAGVIPQLRLVDQESTAKSQTESPKAPSRPFGAGLSDELKAGQKVALDAAEDSPWDGQLMSPIDAIKQVAPSKGEASNWIIWTAMTIAGLARVLLVGTGYLIARGGDTRIKAGVVAAVIVLALSLAALLGAAA